MSNISTLRHMISSGSESTGLDAVAELSNADSPEAVHALVEALSDPRWRVRKAAADALQQMAGPEVVEMLVEVVRKQVLDENSLNTAIQVLSSAGAEVVMSIAGLLSEPDPQVRLHAAQILGLLHEPHGAAALRKALSDRDENVRFHVVEALASLRDLPSVPLLLTRLGHETPFVRFAIVEALGNIGDTRAIPELIHLLEDDLLRPAAVRSLSYFADERPVEVLVRLLHEDEIEAPEVARTLVAIQERYAQEYGETGNIAELVRQAAPQGLAESLRVRLDRDGDTIWIKLLSWLKPSGMAALLLRQLHSDKQRVTATEVLSTMGPDALDFVEAELNDDDPEIRKAAVMVLGRVGKKRFSQRLVELLDDESVEVRLAVGEALAKLGDQSVLDPLLAHLDDEDARIRQSIVEGISSIGSPHTLDRVLPLLTSESAHTREAAVQILGYFGFAEALNPIVEMADDPDEAVRRATLAVLPYFDDPRAYRAVFDALASPSPRIRGDAVRALGRSGIPGAAQAVVRALKDPAPWVRYRACIALGELGEEASRKVLVPLLSDPVPMVRVAACRALQQTRGRMPVEALASLASEDDPDVRYAALSALSMTRHPAALKTLKAAMASEEPQSRIAGALGLTGFGSKGTGALLALAKNDHDEDVRHAALEALAGIRTPSAVRALLGLATDSRLRENVVADLVEVAADQIATLAQAAGGRDRTVALTAISVLTRMKRQEATEALAKIASDAKLGAAVREAAREGLGVLGHSGPLYRSDWT